MKTNGLGRAVANVAGPLVVLAIPKCPLCLLPLLALFGVAVEPKPVLNALVIVLVAVWFALLVRAARSHTMRLAALLGGGLVVAGRLWAISAVSWAGIVLMFGIAIVRLFARERICAGACTPLHRQER